MRRRRLLWQLYPSYLLITLAALLAVGWLATYSLRQVSARSRANELQVRGELLREELRPLLIAGDQAQVRKVAARFARLAEVRVTLAQRDGTIVFDSDQPHTEPGSRPDRPEMAEALRGRPATARRSGPASREELLYVALPVLVDGEILAAVRVSAPATGLDQAQQAIHWRLATGGLVVAVLAAMVCLFVSRRISRPLEQIRQGAERFARGELDYELAEPASEELAGLAAALNRMARQLKDRIDTIVRQSNEQEAILGSMAEGVLAVDNQEQIISINTAAAELLGCRPSEAHQHRLSDLNASLDLQRVVARTLGTGQPLESDLQWDGEPARIFQVRGTPLYDAAGQTAGAVIVLNDVTRLRRLENLRRDFVANVSHELKTPIASIKGFVETLLDGADPESSRRFLSIIAKQADRLNAIIEDLLTLSKMEQSEGGGDIQMQWTPLDRVVREAIEECQTQASERQIAVRCRCQGNVEHRVNAALLEQAIVNLLDNAIKYSEPGREVTVAVEQTDGDTLIRVIDQGCGIEKQHLSRLFERFYRVDRARSRKQGGTGLGLAIVKHIVGVHGGQVSVQSVPGAGSTFTIRLPRSL